jgi:membrane dipeptidase
VNCFVGPIYVEAWFKPEKALRRALVVFEAIASEVAEDPEFHLVRNVAELESCRTRPGVGMILGAEGGEFIEDSLELLHVFHQLGMRCVGLVHGEPNLLADAGSFRNSKGGLTPFGRRAIAEMEDIGCIVDAAHLPSVGLNQLLDIAREPFLLSHSWPEGMPEKYGLSREQIRRAAALGCVIGISSTNCHAKDEASGPIPDVRKYVEIMKYLADIAGGVDCIGLGFDFDYFVDAEFLRRRYPDTIFEPVKDLEGPEKVGRLLDLLRQEGFSDEDVRRIAGGNFVRLAGKVWR